MAEGLKQNRQEQDQTQSFEHAFAMAQQRHKAIEPHNLSPEAVEKLTEIMDEAIVAYERYKSSNDIKDGQEALLLLEKYRDEFVAAKRDKEVAEKSERDQRNESESYAIEVADDLTHLGVSLVDIDGTPYMKANSKEGSFVITNGSDFRSKISGTSLYEYDGDVIFRRDDKLLNSEGESIVDNLSNDVQDFFVVDNGIYILRKTDEPEEFTLEDYQTGKIHEINDNIPQALFKVNDELVYRTWVGEEGHIKKLMTVENPQQLTEEYGWITPSIPYDDGYLFLVRKRKDRTLRDWTLIKNGNEEYNGIVYDKISSDLASFKQGELILFAAAREEGPFSLVDQDGNVLLSLEDEEFDSFPKIKALDENRGYVIGISDRKIVKKVFDLRDL